MGLQEIITVLVFIQNIMRTSLKRLLLSTHTNCGFKCRQTRPRNCTVNYRLSQRIIRLFCQKFWSQNSGNMFTRRATWCYMHSWFIPLADNFLVSRPAHKRLTLDNVIIAYMHILPTYQSSLFERSLPRKKIHPVI